MLMMILLRMMLVVMVNMVMLLMVMMGLVGMMMMMMIMLMMLLMVASAVVFRVTFSVTFSITFPVGMVLAALYALPLRATLPLEVRHMCLPCRDLAWCSHSHSYALGVAFSGGRTTPEGRLVPGACLYRYSSRSGCPHRDLCDRYRPFVWGLGSIVAGRAGGLGWLDGQLC